MNGCSMHMSARSKIASILDSLEEKIDVMITDLTEESRQYEKTEKRIDALYALLTALVASVDENPTECD